MVTKTVNFFVESNGKKYEMRGFSCTGVYSLLLAKGKDKMNFRSWTTSYRGYVLFHCSATKDDDWTFEDRGEDIEDSPKSSILGYGILENVVKLDTKERFDEYYDEHHSDEHYEEVLEEFNGKLYAHRFKDAICFDVPIIGVPGSRNYWTPKKENQIEAFKLAKKDITEHLKNKNR